MEALKIRREEATAPKVKVAFFRNAFEEAINQVATRGPETASTVLVDAMRAQTQRLYVTRLGKRLRREVACNVLRLSAALQEALAVLVGGD